MKTIFLLLAACTFFGNNPQKDEDVKVILEKTFLTKATEPLLHMMADATCQENDNEIAANDLIQEFKDNFRNEEVLAGFAKPYEIFSDEELHELRKIYENPVFEKFVVSNEEILTPNVENLRTQMSLLAKNILAKKQVLAYSPVVEISGSNFDDIFASNKPVIIDINAKWCSPCRKFGPIFEEVSQQYDNVTFAKMDYDSNSELAMSLGVQGLPTVAFFKPGQKTPAMVLTGFHEKENFKAQIDAFLAKQ